jgi:hypothetical protein
MSVGISIYKDHLRLVNAGSKGINQMASIVKDTEVYFGIIRVAFGTGRFRRTKWVFVSWSGDKVSCSAGAVTM